MDPASDAAGDPGYDLDAEVAAVVRRPHKVSFATGTQSDDVDSRNVSAAPPTPEVELVPVEDIYGDNIANLSAVAQMSNLVKLDELTENSILKAVRARFEEHIIYTYVGDMLLATNPFRPLAIYSDREKARFHPSQPVAPVPHIFAIAQKAFKNLTQLHKNQCCLISGESGAGKTETAKLFLNHLLNFEGTATTVLERRIMESQPLLEAFGNAKTVLNDNSSRFGKYVEIYFNHNRVVGATIERYLLEKSRLVGQREGENNFHVFYYLLSGAPAQVRDGLGMLGEHHYNYLHAGGHLLEAETSSRAKARWRCSSKYDMPGAGLVSDVQKYEELVETMSVLEFDDEDISEVHAMLAAVLMLGNLDFIDNEDSDDDLPLPLARHVSKTASDACMILSAAPLRQFGRLFRVRPAAFSALMTASTSVVRGEKIVKGRDSCEARGFRDSIAKNIYEALFEWLVKKLNARLAPKEHRTEDGSKYLEIGVLDIFGFEDFKVNGFEQLCINTANEQLQYFFNQNIFQWELDEYKAEGITVTNITFADNRDQVSMLLGKPVGIFSLLDEECRLATGSDKSCVTKLDKAFSKQKVYRKDKLHPLTFAVLHYAGLITYSANGVRDKNNDAHVAGFTSLAKSSDSALVRALFHDKADTTKGMDSPAGPKRVAASFKYAGANRKKARTAQTVGAKFRASLSSLMLKLETATPHFVRCLKPNMSKEPGTFDGPIALQQLRYTGVMETTRIRSEGFAVRLKFAEFVRQFKILRYTLSEVVKEDGYHCSEILVAANLSDWQLGNTKVFLKYYHLTALVEKMEVYNEKASVIHRAFKCHVARRELGELRQAQARALAEKQQRHIAEAREQERLQRAEDEANAAAAATALRVARASDIAIEFVDENGDGPECFETAGAVAVDTTPSDLGDVGTADELPPAPASTGEEGGDGVNAADPMMAEVAAASVDTVVNENSRSPSAEPVRRVSGPIKATVTDVDKHGTVTKGDVGARLAMWSNMGATKSHEQEHDHSNTLTRGVHVADVRKSFKFNVKAMLPAQLRAGPAMPEVMPWRKKLKSKKASRQAFNNIRVRALSSLEEANGSGSGADQDDDENDGLGTIMRRRASLTSFMADLSLSRFYGQLMVEAGIEHPEDFLLFSEVELNDLGFKPVHIKKVMAALKRPKKKKK